MGSVYKGVIFLKMSLDVFAVDIMPQKNCFNKYIKQVYRNIK